MKFLSKVSDFLAGSIFKEIKEGVMAYFPPDMSPKEKAEAELKVQSFLHKKQLEANHVLNEAAKQLDKRISDQEGTASDLKTIPVLGHAIIFLRGVQRPAWGFATLLMDYKWFFGSGTFSDQQQTAMIVINLLVLGFLFGERTVKNLEPLIIKVFAKQ
jgi:hypothetical protein